MASLHSISGRTVFPSSILVLASVLAASAPAADLAIQRLSLHQYEDGPLLPVNYEYLPGETGWFTGRVTGFQREVKANADGKGDDQRVRLIWNLRVLDPAGALAEEPQAGRIDVGLVNEDKDWVAKFATNFTIPQFALRGTYRIPVTIKDEIAGKEITGEVTLRVRGEDLPVSQDLGITSFRFLVHEDDRVGLQPAVFQQGDNIFVRFDIVGYALAAKNRFKVDYGIQIFGPAPTPAADADAAAAPATPKLLFSQPVAATESQESFYPQRRVPAGFGVPMEGNAPIGTHILVLTIRDLIANKTLEVRQPFEVR